MNWRDTSKIKFAYNEGKINKGQKIPVDNNHLNWSKKNKKLREHIKFHLSVVQDSKCAYCREKIHFDGFGDPIEHIVPKSLKPKWMYHPKNLCLSCYGCNTKKSKDNTLVAGFGINSEYIDIPITSNAYTILHPYYDKFSDLIVREGFVFKPNPLDTTLKGYNTIKMCDLNRLDLLYTRARKKMNNSKTVQALAVKIILNPSSTKEEKKASKKLIDEIIRKYKYWKELHKK